MKKLRTSIVGAVVISLFALVGCNTAQQASTPVSPTTQAPNSVTSAAGGFTALSDVVSKTKTSVNSGNFSQATQDFNQFEGAWKQVEDGVKTKSPNGYSEIEDALTQVKSALKSSDKVKALQGLQTLETTIASVSQT